MPEPIFVKVGMYIMAPGVFHKPSHQSVSVFASTLSLLGNGYRSTEQTRKSRIVERVVFMRSVSDQRK
jgi:hypothetical protein